MLLKRDFQVTGESKELHQKDDVLVPLNCGGFLDYCRIRLFEFLFDENFRLDCFTRCVTVMFGVYIPHEL